MKAAELTATRLRLLLSSALFLTTIVGVAIFYFANGVLSQVAADVSRTAADADASYNNLQSLQQTEKKLKENESIVQRAGEVVANSQSYQYQNQIVSDINNYASRSNIEITNIDFSTDGKTTQSPGNAPAAPSSGATSAPAAVPAGVQTATITVTLKNPVKYNNFLRFLQSIEQNLTKIQLASISISNDDGGISSDVLTLKVYIK